MVVRIRFRKGRKLSRLRKGPRRAALAASALMTPVAVMFGFLALWRIAADLNWTNSFAIPSGLFSHWQVWLGAAAAVQVCSHLLSRYGRGGEPTASASLRSLI